MGGRGGCRDFSVQGRRSRACLGCRVLEIFEGLETNDLVFRV